MDEIPIKLRQWTAKTDELHMILSAWLKSYKRNSFAFYVTDKAYYDNYKPLVFSILDKSQVLLACNPDDDNHIYGFIVYRYVGDVPIISWVNVKHTFRKLKVATRLMEAVLAPQPGGAQAGALITHFMPWLESVCRQAKLIYNPFLDLKFIGEKKAS